MYFSEFESGYDVFRKFRVESQLRNYLRNSRPEITNFLRNSRPEPKNGVSYKKKNVYTLSLYKIDRICFFIILIYCTIHLTITSVKLASLIIESVLLKNIDRLLFKYKQKFERDNV